VSGIDKTLKIIADQFGNQIVAKLEKEPKPVESVSTGILSVDRILQVGGFPRQRLTTLFGPESGGKTTLALWSIGRALASGQKCVFIDIEQGGSEGYMFSCFANAGVEDVEKHIDNNSLVILRPGDLESAVESAKLLLPMMDLMVFDSISVMVPTALLDTEAGKMTIGLEARVLTTEFKKLNSMMGMYECAVVVISQVRTNIGGYGSPETTTEPKAVRHLASVRMRVSKDGQHRSEKGKPVAQPVKAKIHKNKVGIPFLQAEFEILFGRGVDAEMDALDTARKMGVLRMGGGLYTYPTEGEPLMKVKGKVSAVQFLRDNPEIYERLYEDVLLSDFKDERVQEIVE
jgi:recombination protein RecA